MQDNQNNQTAQTLTLPTWMAIILITILLIGTIVLGLFRFKLIGDAIDDNQIATAMILASPEIASTLSDYLPMIL